MKRQTHREIATALERLHNLAECLLQDLRLIAFGSAIELSFKYIWTADGRVHRDLDAFDEVVYLRLHLVHEMALHGALTEAQLLHPDQINWGLQEVAVVRLASADAEGGRFAHIPFPVHHLEVLWEGERRLDFYFSYLEVDDD